MNTINDDTITVRNQYPIVLHILPQNDCYGSLS